MNDETRLALERSAISNESSATFRKYYDYLARRLFFQLQIYQHFSRQNIYHENK